MRGEKLGKMSREEVWEIMGKCDGEFEEVGIMREIQDKK